MAAHVHLKNKFTEDEKCHNVVSWLKLWLRNVENYPKMITNYPPYLFRCSWHLSIIVENLPRRRTSRSCVTTRRRSRKQCTKWSSSSLPRTPGRLTMEHGLSHQLNSVLGIHSSRMRYSFVMVLYCWWNKPKVLGFLNLLLILKWP